MMLKISNQVKCINKRTHLMLKQKNSKQLKYTTL